jgi:hypothetical protein
MATVVIFEMRTAQNMNHPVKGALEPQDKEPHFSCLLWSVGACLLVYSVPQRA